MCLRFFACGVRQVEGAAEVGVEVHVPRKGAGVAGDGGAPVPMGAREFPKRVS